MKKAYRKSHLVGLSILFVCVAVFASIYIEAFAIDKKSVIIVKWIIVIGTFIMGISEFISPFAIIDDNNLILKQGTLTSKKYLLSDIMIVNHSCEKNLQVALKSGDVLKIGVSSIHKKDRQKFIDDLTEIANKNGDLRV